MDKALILKEHQCDCLPIFIWRNCSLAFIVLTTVAFYRFLDQNQPKEKRKKNSYLVRKEPSCLLCKTLAEFSFFRTQLLRKKHLRFVHSNYFKPSTIVFLIKIRTAGTYNFPLGQTAAQYWCVRKREKKRVRERFFCNIACSFSHCGTKHGSTELPSLERNFRIAMYICHYVFTVQSVVFISSFLRYLDLANTQCPDWIYKI